MFKSVQRVNGSLFVVRLGENTAESIGVHRPVDGFGKVYGWSLNVFDASNEIHEVFQLRASSPRELSLMLSQVRQQLDDMSDIVFVPVGCTYKVELSESGIRTLWIDGPSLGFRAGMLGASRGDMVTD